MEAFAQGCRGQIAPLAIGTRGHFGERVARIGKHDGVARARRAFNQGRGGRPSEKRRRKDRGPRRNGIVGDLHRHGGRAGVARDVGRNP